MNWKQKKLIKKLYKNRWNILELSIMFRDVLPGNEKERIKLIKDIVKDIKPKVKYYE